MRNSKVNNLITFLLIQIFQPATCAISKAGCCISHLAGKQETTTAIGNRPVLFRLIANKEQ
jgi:hypothetical protein